MKNEINRKNGNHREGVLTPNSHHINLKNYKRNVIQKK